ncbi:unnamed protein product [Lupinus luteus]|uniref:Uncharacterized protein n=1 Tax=Lupinus luteus TaxID=3873 RepID=A0AAV1X5X8_LUPLU
MAEKVEPSPLTQSHTISPPPSYVEVKCTSSGNTRRFAPGTDAGFAVRLINRKLKKTMMVVSHIEAVKDGEEPIAFGPNSVLINFGNGWMLQTVTDSGVKNGDGQFIAGYISPIVSGVPGLERKVSKPISPLYFVKIVFAFIMIFVLGAIFTLLLDNLPELILFVKSIV